MKKHAKGPRRSPCSAFLTAAALLCGLCSADGSGAAIIFDNVPHYDPGPSAIYADRSGETTREAADDFVLTSGATVVRSVYWEGTYTRLGLDAQDNFILNIYNDQNGAPGALHKRLSTGLTTKQVAAGSVVNLPLFAYQANVGEVELLAGQTYWLGISNDTGGHRWAWGETNPNLGPEHYLSAFDNRWHPLHYALIFRLSDTPIPEPRAFSLAAVSLLVCVHPLIGIASQRAKGRKRH
jgi:hypothetical protein